MKRKDSEVEGERRSKSTRTSESEGESSTSKARSDPVRELHRRVGNQGVGRLHENGDLQASLTVSQPGDEHEREAERVADEVMQAEGAPPVVDAARSVQRRESGGSMDGASTGEAGTEDLVQSARTGGKPMSRQNRSFFESRFGRDFGDVSVHTGQDADRAARSIDAEAFTMGNDIAFAKGNYEPSTSSGKRLMAHELTHVVQQGGAEPKSAKAAGAGQDRMDPGVARSLDGTGGGVPGVQRQAAAQGGTRFGTYTVEEGDSLWAIANRFGVEGGPEQIAEWNDMAVDEVIHPDDKLKLPAEKLPDQGSGGGEATSGGAGSSGQQGGQASGSGGGTDLPWDEIYEAFAEVGREVTEVADWILENLDEFRRAWIEVGEDVGGFAGWISEQFTEGEGDGAGDGSPARGKVIDAIDGFDMADSHKAILREAFRSSDPGQGMERIAQRLEDSAGEIGDAMEIVDGRPLSTEQKTTLVQALLFPYPRPDLSPEIIRTVSDYDEEDNPQGLGRGSRMKLLKVLQSPAGSRIGAESVRGEEGGGYTEATDENIEVFKDEMGSYISSAPGDLRFGPEELLQQSSDISEQSPEYQALPPRELWSNMEDTLNLLGELSERSGVAIAGVYSAYRSALGNALCGGAAGSNHQKFMGLDVRPADRGFYDWVHTNFWRVEGGMGIGFYGPTRMHVDSRSNKAYWGTDSSPG